MKAISTAVKRNVDYHSIYEQHHTKTQSMRQEIDQLQLEKSMQVKKLTELRSLSLDNLFLIVYVLTDLIG